MQTPPPQSPHEGEWPFVGELKEPRSRHVPWGGRALGGALAEGVRFEWDFPDNRKLLATAYESLETFLQINGIRTGGRFTFETRLAPSLAKEAFQMEVDAQGCRLSAKDSEGIRRGLYWIEDRLREADRPHLEQGLFERRPVVRTRISRCFFGPIQRPPMNRDELADDVDYYPEAYLERLAYEGVNGLWLTLRFSDVCRTEFFPHHGKDAERRLEKLRRTVEKCARYGIRIFPFCIEPRAFGAASYNHPLSDLERHPELAGHRFVIDGVAQMNFCVSEETGKAYLETATRCLFEAVPGLGGLIMINLGERPTHCYSALPNLFQNHCPRCSSRQPWEVFHDVLAPVQRGMAAINPEAELISWLYVPSLLYKGGSSDDEPCRRVLREIAEHLPAGVTLQLNFESSGISPHLGRDFVIQDYSLAYIGPSAVFEDCARAATSRDGRIGAKLQVGCSHEVASVPWVPVPGHLYRKYSEMHRLNVTSAMQCWYFGNYPSLMTRAAGALSFAPLPASEEAFLEQLARVDWSGDAPHVVEAWRHFQSAYEEFPRQVSFSWFGPVHDAIAWPLHLFPVDQILAPSWKFGYPPSGDRVGELAGLDYRLCELIAICETMQARWSEGVRILHSLRPRHEGNRERLREIGVAEALGLQLRSAWNLLRFYARREQLPYDDPPAQRKGLKEMEALVREEIELLGRLAVLCGEDSRLGFHSEAEGYRYFPARLQWRIDTLHTLLNEAFPAVLKQINQGEALFTAHTGVRPEGKVYRSPFSPERETAPLETCGEISDPPADKATRQTAWQATWDREHLYVRVTCPTSLPPGTGESVTVSIEPRRLWPGLHFTVEAGGGTHCECLSSLPLSGWRATSHTREKQWLADFTIPFRLLGERNPVPERLRINVARTLENRTVLSWVPIHRLEPRICLGTYRPGDYGWLFLEATME